MTSEHGRMQLMAASAIDGRLTADEQDELLAHLADCPECREFHAALLRDNAWLVDILTPVPVPGELRATVAEAERSGLGRKSADGRSTVVRPLNPRRAPRMSSLVGALVAVFLIALTAGAGLWMASRQRPSTGPAAAASETPSSMGHSPSASPSGDSAGRTPPLGGAPLLIYGFNEEKFNTTLSLIDVDTGERTRLGGLPFRSIIEHTRLQWNAEREQLLITRFLGSDAIDQLVNPSDSATSLDLVCCLPEGPYVNWTLSPDGDQLAGLEVQERDLTVTGIAIQPIDGGTGQSIPTPAGVTLFDDFVWAPDGSALAIAGCGPCMSDRPTELPAEHHAKLFVVPVDGSPVREIVDLPDGSLGSPAWSPDGSQIAVNTSSCSNNDEAPDCAGRTHVIADVAVSDGALTELSASSEGHGKSSWSPDGTRLAYFDGARLVVASVNEGVHAEIATVSERPTTEPMWSPDGSWLVYGTQQPDRDDHGLWKLWIVSIDGGLPRSLGTARAWAW